MKNNKIRSILNKVVFYEKDGETHSGTVERCFTDHGISYAEIGFEHTVGTEWAKVDDCYLSEEELLNAKKEQFEDLVTKNYEYMDDLFLLLQSCFIRLPEQNQEDKAFKEAVKRRVHELVDIQLIDF